MCWQLSLPDAQFSSYITALSWDVMTPPLALTEVQALSGSEAPCAFCRTAVIDTSHNILQGDLARAVTSWAFFMTPERSLWTGVCYVDFHLSFISVSQVLIKHLSCGHGYALSGKDQERA